MEKRLITLLLLLFATHAGLLAQSNDFGMWYELSAEKKLSKQWSGGVEAMYRSRNNARTGDRWSVAVDAEYKIVKKLKASAGYAFLRDNFKEEMDLKSDGFRYNKWTPSYWGTRHRFHVDLSGSYDIGRFSLSLRERWQYTYRPEAEGKKYDFDEEAWKPVKGKGKHVWRNRLQVEYDIAQCKFDPFANVEMFVDDSGIEKMRYHVGVDYKYRKQHTFALTYRYQKVNTDDDDFEVSSHLLGLSYKYKF